jgi:hypothetical protein
VKVNEHTVPAVTTTAGSKPAITGHDSVPAGGSTVAVTAGAPIELPWAVAAWPATAVDPRNKQAAAVIPSARDTRRRRGTAPSDRILTNLLKGLRSNAYAGSIIRARWSRLAPRTGTISGISSLDA